MLLKDTIEIGKRIYEVRKRKGLTQAEVAEITGLSDRAYAEIERGATNARILTLIGVCEALDITPDEMLSTPDKEETEKDIVELLKYCTEKQKKKAYLR